MKKMRFKMKSAVAGIALVLASAIPGSAAIIHVPADYSTIQAAVDAAASGDTIQIAAGVYTGQVVIANKTLTLSGSPGAVLRAKPGMQESLAPYTGHVPLLGIFESEVIVSGLTFEGERLADSEPYPPVAIYFLSASGRVEGCHITGFRGSELGNVANNWGYGVETKNPHYLADGPVDIQVLQSTFDDNVVSIRLMGDAPPHSDQTLLRTTFTVTNNTIIGNGPDANGRQIGIQIFAGAGGEVKRNIITDHAYIGTDEPIPYSFGILAEDEIHFRQGAPLAALQPLQFEGNILLNNQVDLLLVHGDGSMIVNNSFGGAAPGYRAGGLGFSGENVTVAANSFDTLPFGITLLGADPNSGTYLGVTSDAKVVANGFCDVPAPIVIEPLVSGTVEHGNNFDACQ